MSQVNTGLGWSAKDNWLMGATGTVGNIGGFSFPGYSDQPIPKYCTNNATTVTAGFVGAVLKYGANQTEHTYYFGCESDADMLVCMIDSANSYDLVVFNLNSAKYGRYAYVTTATTSGDRGLTTRYGSTDIYTKTLNILTKSYTTLVSVNIPVFSSLAEAVAAIQIAGTAYNKLNPGYAVACAAEWYTPEGTHLKSPILISSVPEYTVMTVDGTTPAPNMTIFDFLKDGMRFYMSLISNNTDTVSTLFEYANLTQFGAAMPSKVFSLLADESFSNIIVLESPDPYEEETDPNAEDGGGGTDPEDDEISEITPSLPSVAGIGFSTVYVPSQSELMQLASYLWSGAFDINSVIKLFSNPMDSILGLSAVPLSLVGSPESIYIGGVQIPNLTMPKYSGRTSPRLSMGTVTITEKWGSYLDYEPYTKFSVYLPFIGIKPLSADDIMGKTISLSYVIDILSGACVASIRPMGASVLYEWSGQASMQIPITARNWDNVFQTSVATAISLAGAIAAPSTAPVLAGAVASNAAQALTTKPHTERSGAVSGTSGYLGELRPYIIRETPDAVIPADQNKFIGYPSFITVNLGSLTGYNEIDSIHLENIPATGNELSEIENLLKGGVIF